MFDDQILSQPLPKFRKFIADFGNQPDDSRHERQVVLLDFRQQICDVHRSANAEMRVVHLPEKLEMFPAVRLVELDDFHVAKERLCCQKRETRASNFQKR